jgi:glutaredoxin
MPESCSFNSCASTQPKKTVRIDFLYLDTTVCGRCQGTEKALDDAVADVSTVLNAAGYEVHVNKANIATRELAQQYRFISSPTIRVNGQDIALELAENLCEDCGELCGDDVDCRVWVYNGVEYTIPPKEMIVDAILRGVYGGKQSCQEAAEYSLPPNLEKYFAAKAIKDSKTGKTGQKQGDSTMKKMKIFEPAMCCPTGLCGVGIDPELLRISTVLNTLKNNGVVVERFNLNSAPMEFITNKAVSEYINAHGAEGLPVTVLDGEIVLAGRYPTNEEFAKLLDLPEDTLTAGSRKVRIKKMPTKSDCGCKGGCC